MMLDHAGLWAIAAYFNPVGYRRRLSNYRQFRARLGVPLVTVELSFDGDFELREDDADLLIQRRGQGVLWQKERLLNIALEHLPDDCRYVLWADADLIYTRPGWQSELIRALEEHLVVQAFRRATYLARDATVEQPTPADDLPHVFSLVSQLAAGRVSLDNLDTVQPRGVELTTTGFAWAARREVLARSGLYDACIVGGGDRAFACAALGRIEDEVRSHTMNPARAAHYRRWAHPVHDLIRGRVGYLDADVLHLWHGDLINRNSPRRHAQLDAFGFDPETDIALDAASCWRWNSDKPALHQFLRDYFVARHEDG